MTTIDNAYVSALDRKHVFHSWSVQDALSPLVIAGGRGCMIWDHEGREYLDFSSQLVNTNLGHQHPAVIAGIKAQADTLATIAPSVANLARGEAAMRILSHAPQGFSKIFFTNGGADANENAMRMARLVTGRDKILSGYRSYHGNTGGAIVATGDARRVPNEFSRGHVHFFTPYAYRSEFDATSDQEECDRALKHLRRVIEAEGPVSIAAILLESVPGTAGILVPPKGYMKGVRALADEFGIMVIIDEVMSGFGRTGKWLAVEHHEMVPDLITFAKGVNSGYVPVGGVIISDKIVDYFSNRYFPGGLTYSGHPLAMASIVAAIDAMEAERVIENAHMIGLEVLGPKLRELAKRHSVIGEVRGIGLFWAIEFVSDRSKKTPLPAKDMAALKNAILARGMLPFVVENRIHVVPPCIVSQDQVEKGIGILDAAIATL